jgi:transposase-like protein
MSGVLMEKHEVKILSYIRNFKKIIFICPICRENNSHIIKDENIREFDYKCEACRKQYIVGVNSLQEILKGMR